MFFGPETEELDIIDNSSQSIKADAESIVNKIETRNIQAALDDILRFAQHNPDKIGNLLDRVSKETEKVDYASPQILPVGRGTATIATVYQYWR